MNADREEAVHRRFTLKGQLAFAELSGDYNPLHTDPVAARRSLFGSVVVHGIHSVLWALDCWVSEQRTAVTLKSLRALFKGPIRLENEVVLRCGETVTEGVTLDLFVGSVLATHLEFDWEPARPCAEGTGATGSAARPVEPMAAVAPDPSNCRVRLLADLEGAAGGLSITMDKGLASSLFEQAVRKLPAVQLAQLLATTRLVGMECPGLHSLFGTLDMTWRDERGK
jgi:hypothetical protein